MCSTLYLWLGEQTAAEMVTKIRHCQNVRSAHKDTEEHSASGILPARSKLPVLHQHFPFFLSQAVYCALSVNQVQRAVLVRFTGFLSWISGKIDLVLLLTFRSRVELLPSLSLRACEVMKSSADL